MNDRPAQVFLARHGQTEWSLLGLHTGRKDIPLTAHGEEEARKLGARLNSRPFAAVFCSPLQRAKQTCDLGGYGAAARLLPDLMEWDYGDYEGRRAGEIRADRPDWRLFRDGCPAGESPEDVAARVARVLPQLQAVGGDAIVFAHGHLLRMLMAGWMRMPPELAARYSLDPASLSILTRDVHTGDPIVDRWNDISHLQP